MANLVVLKFLLDNIVYVVDLKNKIRKHWWKEVSDKASS